MSKKISAETVKLESDGLRGSLPEEVANSDDHFSEAGKLLLKFHGIYEQHDREQRGKKVYSFMIRSKVPGGRLTAEQYLTHDRLASKYANDTLRITTRQTFQFHGILKDDLAPSLRELNHAFVTTLGACGDIVRNVIACPAPGNDPQRIAVQDFALHLTQALYPRTTSYHQIWLDGEEMVKDEVLEEPLYGPTYLPRKFKIAIAFPGDNCVDVYTNDLGLVAIFDNEGVLTGFNVLVGGGMGTTHNNAETFARLASEVGFVLPEQVVDTVKAVVTIHRDYGDRENRKHARLKYVLEDRGVEWFKEELQRLVDFPIQEVRPMPEFDVDDHMGWHDQGDNLWYIGLPVENGRIIDRDTYRLRSGLRTIIERFNLPVRLTAQQSILLTDIRAEDKAEVEALLQEYGIRVIEDFSNVRRYAMACPALPTCSLAITEAERILPAVIDELETTLNELGIPDEAIAIRMTGCPNGCARPFVAEIGFVGRSLDKYTMYLGGSFNGTRLARPFLDLVHIKDLVPTLRPILTLYRDQHQPKEGFGDFVNRTGFDALHDLVNQQAVPEAVAIAEVVTETLTETFSGTLSPLAGD
ncbi:MAG TPA: NADPH-dependent assimilatory sulfite reductase hemoprotein subunit [Phototrophicaceae bacterium]|jgi:sulfite reductase (ferredoxin)|nr:NADPH-dependent assimilatory sulfite reductase hemoprotein subunit [Phototrophicaceae bacterium]